MIVTVVDRALLNRLWGNGYKSINQVIKTIEISDNCPKCGGMRGPPKMQRYCEDDEWYSVSRWGNPCGHVDMYEDVLKEAALAKAGESSS